VPKQQPRWARYDLHDAFNKAERDPKAVQHLLNAEDDQFHAWISGREAMPMNTQIMLAGVLGLPLSRHRNRYRARRCGSYAGLAAVMLISQRDS
jgi:hypothetical protein